MSRAFTGELRERYLAAQYDGSNTPEANRLHCARMEEQERAQVMMGKPSPSERKRIHREQLSVLRKLEQETSLAMDSRFNSLIEKAG